MDESQNHAEQQKSNKEHMLWLDLCEIVEQVKLVYSDKKHTRHMLIIKSRKEDLFQRGINKLWGIEML